MGDFSGLVYEILRRLNNIGNEQMRTFRSSFLLIRRLFRDERSDLYKETRTLPMPRGRTNVKTFPNFDDYLMPFTLDLSAMKNEAKIRTDLSDERIQCALNRPSFDLNIFRIEFCSIAVRTHRCHCNPIEKETEVKNETNAILFSSLALTSRSNSK